MKKLWLRICSLVLVVVMTAQSLPLNVWAEQNQNSKPASTETEQMTTKELEALTAEETQELLSTSKVVDELTEERTEFTKEFQMDSGLTMAVVYDSAVHYKENGQWEEIDNTLKTNADGSLTNTAGVWDISFPQQISRNNQISITKDGYTMSFGMAGELRQQGNLEIMSQDEEELTVSAVNVSDAAQNSIAETEATVPETTEAETTAATEPVAEDTTAPTEAVPETTAPEATVPEATEPEATEPATTAPIELAPVETLTPVEQTTSVMIDGKAQTFAVSTAKTVNAQIKALDHKEALEATAHKETVLTKPVSQLMYANVYSNTDIQYDLRGKQLKESVILESYNSTLRGYQFSMNTGELVPVLEEDGAVNLYDKEENIVFHMPAPFLKDSKEEYSYDVKVLLSGKDGAYTLTYLLPKQWLASSDRAWPVILDPVVAADMDINNIRDRTIMSKASSAQDWGYGQIGRSSTSGIARFLLKYDDLPDIGVADVIVSASARLRRVSSSNEIIPIEVHRVTGSWKSESVTWDNKPTYDATVSELVLMSQSGGWSTWDITEIVRSWYTSGNYGMVFKAPTNIEQGSATSYRQVHSSDYSTSYSPQLFIFLRNSNGLEGYWSYTSSSAGRAGTGSVNQYTGNLVWVHNDMGFGGSRMPISINHVYNTNDRAVTRNGLGNGWRTNYNQRIYTWSSNNLYKVWDDEDGTKHYFLYDKTKDGKEYYKDEDGLEMTLVYTPDNGVKTYKLTDKYGNYHYFDSAGRLRRYYDTHNSLNRFFVTYTGTTGHRIQTLQDGVGRKYNFTYNGDNLLKRISYVGHGTSEITYMTFTYTGTDLTKITYADGKTTNFTYVGSHLLATVKDNDGYKLEYGYTSTTTGKPCRVNSIKEFDVVDENTTVAGGELSIEYSQNQTKLTDHNTNVQLLQFNNMGNVVSIQDGEGRAQYAKYAKNDAEESGKGNQLTASSKLQNTVVNLLLNSSFEGDTHLWTGGEITTSAAYMGSKSLKLPLDNSTTAISPTFKIAAGESATFSAYVKTDGTNSVIKLMDVTSTTSDKEVVQKISNASEWTRVEVNYTNTDQKAKTLQAAVVCGSGETVYVDCVQAERMPTASRYNLVDNGDFTASNTAAEGWTGSPYTIEESTTKAAPQVDNKVMKIEGLATHLRQVRQVVQVSGQKGDTFVVSGWAKAHSIPLRSTRQFGVQVIFHYLDDSSTEDKDESTLDGTHTAVFNPCVSSDQWQYSSAAAVAKANYDYVTVQIAYDCNSNTAWFDAIQLFKEEFSESYTYDSNNNLISVTDLQKQVTEYTYKGNRVETVKLPNGEVTTYHYNNYGDLTRTETPEGVIYNYTYDKYGNNTAISVTYKTGENSEAEKTITTYADYGDANDSTQHCNYLKSTTDALGNTTNYDYNENTGVLNSVKYPEDTDQTKTFYTYDNMYRMATAAATMDSGLALSASYTYDGDLLTSITTGVDRTTEGEIAADSKDTTYTFNYGNFSLRSNIKIGNYTLASYTYTDRNNYLSSLDYGNGDKVEYEYDQQGRVTKQTYEDGKTVTYRYDNDGALATVTDDITDRTTTYYYDFIDRMMRYVESGTDYHHAVGYSYDELNNLTGIVETINGTDYSTSYAYDDYYRVASITGGNSTEAYTYDSYGRVSQQQTKQGDAIVKTDSFQFADPETTDDDGPRTSSQVTSHTIDTAGYDKTFTYTYDDNGNILTISDGTNTTSYAYDSANQLVREDNPAKNYIHTWTYDNAGNILNRKEYTYTTGELGTPTHTYNYTYGDSDWGDLLTAYDGNTIYSDAIGNPLEVRNSEGNVTTTYTWQHGRQLKSMSDGTNTWTFTYNADGIRTNRTNGSTTYNYIYNGEKLSQMTVGTDVLNFFYDASGTPMSVQYNGTTYYYVTNIQSDVIAILNDSGTAVVEYAYDAWGNILGTTGSMATTLGETNPLRYRGYTFDSETDLYYLQSRYYSPEVGRFLNADGVTSTGQGLLGNNMFAYCNNNSVILSDSLGNRPYSELERFGEVSLPVPPKRKKSKQRKNDAAVAAFYGTSTSNIPDIPDGAMLFVENIVSVNVGKYLSVIRGKTLVMDRDKYCEYYFWGIGAGNSGVNNALADKTYTKGYVYGVEEVTDYCGFFAGGSSNLVASVQGGAWAPGVHAEIIAGTNSIASVGGSITYYATPQPDWVYGAADFYVVPNTYQTSPLNPNVYC